MNKKDLVNENDGLTVTISQQAEQIEQLKTQIKQLEANNNELAASYNDALQVRDEAINNATFAEGIAEDLKYKITTLETQLKVAKELEENFRAMYADSVATMERMLNTHNSLLQSMQEKKNNINNMGE